MQVDRTLLTHDVKVIETRRGTQATQGNNPSFMLTLGDTFSEPSGEVIAGALAWTGNFRIITSGLIPEAKPSLIVNGAIAITTILSYGAMAGFTGGGGLGVIAINYGYYRYKYLVMLLAVILLILLVQLFQSVGTKLAVRSDKRLRHKAQ